jgi:hypothetical protein
MAIVSSGIDAEIKSARGCNLKVLVSGKPSSVLVSGKAVTDWSFDATSKMLIVKLPGGTIPLKINN